MYKLLFLILTFLSGNIVFGQATDSLLLAYYPSVIRVLANDSMMGRPAASVYEQKCARFIAGELAKKKKAKVKIQSFQFTHPDSSKSLASENVYCFINNKKDSTVLIGAHYDHIGMGGKLSRSFLKKEVHNGADDNASGIALLLGLYKNYKNWYNPHYNYLFVTYSAHEIGLFGSTAFSELVFKNQFKKVALVINFDMVGRLDPNEKRLRVVGSTGYAPLRFFDQSYEELKFRTENDYFLLQSDAKAFYKADFPCLFISSGQHDDYHKSSDDEVKINYQGILEIQKMMEAFLRGI